jgi:hypothetical protein
MKPATAGFTKNRVVIDPAKNINLSHANLEPFFAY